MGMLTEAIDRGSPVLVEIEFKRQVPFGNLEYFNPTNPVVIITDPWGNQKVVAGIPTQSSTGKWYYVCQTEKGWLAGNYTCEVNCDSDTFSDVTIEIGGFRLK